MKSKEFKGLKETIKTSNNFAFLYMHVIGLYLCRIITRNQFNKLAHIINNNYLESSQFQKAKYELDWQNDSCCFYREK